MANRLASLKSEDGRNRKISFFAGQSQTPPSDMERRMEDEEESLMKEWERTVKHRHEDSLSIRPLSVSSGESVKTSTTSNMRIGSSRTASLAENSSGSLSFDFPEIDVAERRDAGLGDDGVEIVDDESRRFAYFDSPDTGQRCMKMDLNVEGFEPKDITVKSLGGRLVIHGISWEIVDGVRHTNEFCRKIKLPDEVAAESVRCTFSDHVLAIEAPLRSQRASANGSQDSNKIPLNCPVILSDENGRYLSLTVEIGRIFKPCDVVVKVKGQRTISIVAEAVENTAFSRMNARLDREFDLPEKIDRKSLKAGCTEDLLLKIVARVKNDSPDSAEHDLGNCIL